MTISSLIILAFISAFVVTFIATPFVKKIAYKVGAIDIPKDNRRMHKKPVARLGGLAIFLGFLLSVLMFANIDNGFRGIIIGSIIIVILGIFDDIYQLSAKIKLAVQIIAAIIPVLDGVVINQISVPKFISPTGWLSFGIFAIPITIFWIVGITNALNLIDGLDGLAVGVASISSITLLCIALIVSEPGIALITAALTGACFGFLPYNFNPAKIFMGDSGSLFLGFILSTLSIQGVFKGYTVISFAVPILILGLPIFDTSAAILRRLKKGQPIMSPDRGHLHHKLVDSGFSQKQAVGIIYILCAILCLIAIMLISTGAVRILVIAILVIIFTLFIALNPHISRIFIEQEDENSNQEKKGDSDEN